MGCEHHLSHVRRPNTVDTKQVSLPVPSHSAALFFLTKLWLLRTREGTPSKAWSSSADHNVLEDFMTLSKP